MKKVPKLRFKEFIEEWKEKNLGAICEIIMGQSPSSTNYNENGIGLPLIQGNADCKNRKVYPRVFTSEITKKSIPNDIIMTVRAPVGAIAFSGIESCIGRGVCAIRNANRFIYHYLIKLENSWEKFSQGSTFTAVNGNDIKKLSLNIPNLQEQEKIANFLSSVDKKISLTEEKLELFKNYKKGIMQKIFSQKLRFKDENGNDYPEWEEKKLGEICEITTGKLDANAMVENGKYRFYTCAKEFFFINNYSFDTEALLISGNGANVGYIHYYNGKFNAYQRTYVLDKFSENIIFIKYILEKNLKNRIEKEKNIGSTPYIVLGVLTEMLLNLPCLEEQEKIANFLSSIDEKIEKIENELENLKEFKKGLLQQMFI